MLYRQYAAIRGRWGLCGRGKEQKGQVFRKRHFNQDPKEKNRGQLHMCLGISIPGTGTARTNVLSRKAHGALVEGKGRERKKRGGIHGGACYEDWLLEL